MPSGRVYHASSIGYAESSDGVRFTRRPAPFLRPAADALEMGFEDARVTRLGADCYLFYTSVSPSEDGDLRVQIAGAVTRDFSEVTELGLVAFEEPWWFKAAALFPEKINGRYGFLYTAQADTPRSTICYLETDSIDALFDPRALAKLVKTAVLPPSPTAHRGPELGAVPVRTPHGWLLVYCPESFREEWTIGAALLDLEDPRQVIGKTTAPLLVPETAYELEGYVANVTFPEGATIDGDKLSVYYGAADSGVCLATGSLSALLSSLR